MADASGTAVALSPTFGAATVSYSASVAYEVLRVTLAATAADSRASVVVEPADADSVLAHYQLWPFVGANTITVTVTAEDDATSETYTLVVTRGAPALETVAVSEIDWTQFSRGAPTHDNADQVKAWLLTTLKYALNDWWNTFKNFDAQSSSHYIDFLHSTVMNGGGDTERRYRESTSMALALAVALSTGIYDASVVGVSESVARDRALQLIRSLAYRHDINAPGSQSNGRWGYEWQTDLFAAHTAFAAWLLWDHLPAADQLLVKRIVVAEADTYRSPLYFKDRDGNVLWPGNSKGEDQGWNAHMRSLAAVMMPDHPHADMWKSESILLMLSTYSRPEDVSSDEAFHGHALSDWLNGSNMHSNATVPNHGIIHPDYMAAGLVEFNTAHIYFMANLATPVSAFYNTDRVMEAFVELEFTPGGYTQQPGGTIFRSGTDCGTANSLTALGAVAGCVDTAVTAGQSLEAGHQRGCLAGPPGTDTNVYYPNGSSWSKKRRPNLAMFVSQVDAFDLDYLVDDSTLHADYWAGCFARDVRAMQARHSNGRTWRDNTELNYFGREGQSTVFAAKAWMAYWIEHQAGAEGVTTQDDYYDLEFNRILSIEAEANTNTRNGNLITKQCNNCSGRTYVRFRATGDANSLVIPNVDVGVTAGKRHRLYLVHESKADSTFKVTVTGQQPGETGQYLIRIRGFHRFPIAHTEAEILLYPGTNTLTIVNVARGGFQPNIDRVILAPLPITATPQAQLSNLELSDVALTPEFDPEVLNYDAQVAHEISTTTVTATTAHTEAQTTITPADDDTTTDGDQVDLDVGDNTITVTVTAEDTTIAQTYTVNVTRLADEPQLASATVDGTELTLTYSETLDDGSEPPTSAFSVTVTDAATTTATTPTVSTVDVSGTDVTLTLATAVRHNDTVTVTYTVSPSNPIQDTGTTDAAALTAQTVTNNTTAAATATLSTLGLEDPDNTTVTLDPQFGSADDTDGTYSADVANEVASVTVTGATTDTRAQLTATPKDADTTTNGYQIDLPTALTEASTTTITVTVTAEDTTTSTYTITVTRAPDTTAPTLTSATADGTALVLAYDEALDETSQPAASDFAVSVTDSVTTTTTPAVTDVDITGTDVTLTLAAAVRHNDTVTLDYTPGTNPTQDLAANDAAALASQAVTNNTATATDTTLASVGLIGEDLTQRSLDSLVAVTNSEYEAGVLTAQVTVVAMPADARAVVTITPTDADSQTAEHEVDLVGGDNTITVTVTAEDGATTFTHTILVTRLVDNTPPALSTATLDGTELVLNYDEALNEMSEPAPSAFSVSVVDSATAAASTPTISGVSIETSQVKLTLAAAVRHNDTVTITYTQPSQNKLQDIFGNDAAALSAQTVTNNTAAASDATLSALGLSEVALSPPVFTPDTLVYSTAVTNSVSVVTIGTVTTTDPRATVAISPNDADTETSDHQVELTAALSEASDTTITVTVTAEDGTTGTYTITVARAADTTAPTLVSAAVDGTTLTLAYDSALDTGSKPGESDFTVRAVDSVTGSSLAPEVTAVFVGGREVGLSLDAAVRFRDAVTVSYTAGADPIQDTAANPAASFNARPVNNTTAKASDATLERLTVPGFEVLPEFSANIAMYSLSVVHGVADVTVVAVAADARASVEVTPADTSPALGNQVPLTDQQTTITVTVTAEDSTTTSTYTVSVTRVPVDLGTVPVRTIDWSEFDAGVPTHTKAQQAKGWLLSTVKYALNHWWNTVKNFDAQSGTYLDFVSAPNSGQTSERRYRESSNMALGLAITLSTGAYDASVTGVEESTARDRALKLIRSMAYRHDINAPSSQRYGRWGYSWQSGLWATHAGLAAWLLWDYLSDSDKLLVKKMIIAEADEYRSPQYWTNPAGDEVFPGDSKSEEQGWNAYVRSLAPVMMPDHPNVDMWRTSNIQLLLSTYSFPDDVSSSTIYHGHALSEWLDGSNIRSNGTVTNHGIVHPDYMVSGVEFYPALIFFMAGLPTPEAGRFNIEKVMEAFVELEFTPGRYTRQPGGTIFRAGTLCEGNDLEVASCKADAQSNEQTFEAGHSRGCLAGPPEVDTNVYYPNGSDWSKKRRPNLAFFVAHADVFGFDSLIDDSTLHADYWFSCFVRDVRAMQARHSNGRTWSSLRELNYYGREGQSAHYASKSWMGYWIEHQAGTGGVTYENNDTPLEFNRIAAIEAEASSNTLHGSAATAKCGDCSNRRSVKLVGSGTANALTITGLNAPEAGRYPLYVIYWSEQDRDVTLTVSGGPPYGGGSYDLFLPRIHRDQNRRLAVARATVFLNAGSNNVTIAKHSHEGSQVPRIDRIVLGASEGLLPSSGAVDGISLSLDYPERLDTSSLPAAGDFTVTAFDSFTGTKSTPSIGNVSINRNEVRLTLEETVRLNDRVTLSYTPGTNPLRAAGGQSADGFENVGVINRTKAWTDAFLELLELPDITTFPGTEDPTTYRAFSAAVDFTVLQATLNATARDSRASVVIDPAQDADGSMAGHQVALAVGSNPITVTVTAEDGVTTRLYRVTVTRIQAVKEPAVKGASVWTTGDSMSLQYTEDLDESSQPDEGDFTVRVVDSVTGVGSTPSVSNVSVNEDTVRLDLDSPAYFDDTVTVSYTAGSNPIRDSANNNAINLVDHMLTNYVPLSTNATLSGLELSGVELSEVDLSPEFDSDKTSYSATVASTVTRVTVTAITAHKRASVTVVSGDYNRSPDHQVNLRVGLNAITVAVTAEDGSTTRTYTIAVTRARPMVTSAVVDGTDLVLTFNEDLDDMSVPEVDSFKVLVTTPATLRTVVRPVTAVDVDGNTVTLTLESAVRAGQIVAITYDGRMTPIQSGTEGIAAEPFVNYLVTNETVGGSVAALATLELSGVRLSPEFSSSTTVYSASVTHSTASTTLTATPLDPQAQVAISPADSDAATEGDQVPLTVGPNTITVTVTAADAMTTRDYTVTVTRAQQANEPTLVAASLSGRSLTLQYNEALDQTSEPAASDFSISVTDSVTGETSTPSVTKTRMQQRKVTLTLGAAARFGDTATLSYTAGSNPIQDTQNNNAINLTNHPVTNTTRRASRAALSTLAASGVTLSPAFTSNRYMYSANVANSLTQTTITATPADSRASAQIDANDADSTTPGVQVSLDVGLNTITVTVTAEDRTSTHTYTIAITRS